MLQGGRVFVGNFNALCTWRRDVKGVFCWLLGKGRTVCPGFWYLVGKLVNQIVNEWDSLRLLQEGLLFQAEADRGEEGVVQTVYRAARRPSPCPRQPSRPPALPASLLCARVS